MSIPVNQRSYDQPFPFFARPEVVSEYSVDATRQVRLGRSGAKYLRTIERDARLEFDLNLGKETFVEKDVKSERLDVLLQWATAQCAPRSCRPKKIFHEADIVCWRGLLTRIASAPFSDRDGWRFVAVRVDEVIYLCEYDTDEAKKRKESATPKEQMMSYWGFKFEQYMTADSPEADPDTVSPVDCRSEFAVVCKSRIGVAGSKGRALRLAYGAEVDAIDDNGLLVEMKTQRNALEGGFWKQKSCKWWLQSFLVGLERITVGFRDDGGIVHKVGAVPLGDLTRQGQWAGNVCFNFLSTVLSAVERRLPRGSEDYASCHVVYNPGTKQVHLEEARAEEADFITPEFARHFGLPDRM